MNLQIFNGVLQTKSLKEYMQLQLWTKYVRKFSFEVVSIFVSIKFFLGGRLGTRV